MHCRDCFHNNVCGNSSPYNDVSMCKQFIKHDEVLCGPALTLIKQDYEKLKERNRALESKIKRHEMETHDLEREVELLRIIKQTLEMQSGMKFDI